MGDPAMLTLKEPRLLPPPQAPVPWILPSLFAAFNVMLLVFFGGLFFAFPWLAQNGAWVFPITTGLLFVLAFFSLICLNFSDPGILHRGSGDQGPTMVHVVWVNRRAFRLQWCRKCCFHRPPRTYHCPWCNICVEDFDHHCKWVNNCIGHRNFRLFMLLVLSLFLFSGAVLATCLVYLVRTNQLPFSTDKAVAYQSIVVAIASAVFLVPLFLLLLIQAMSVSAAERSYEGKCNLLLTDNISKGPYFQRYHSQCRYLQGYNPFDQGCASNWYFTMCAPLGPKYMAEAIWLQRVVGHDQQHLHSTRLSAPSPPALSVLGPGSQPQPQSLYKPGKEPPGSVEASAVQEDP